jgi:hypothetical protein
MEFAQKALFESNVIFNIIDFLEVYEVIKLERLSLGTRAKLRGFQHAVTKLTSRLFNVEDFEASYSITFAQLKVVAKQTLHSKFSCRIQMVPYH